MRLGFASALVLSACALAVAPAAADPIHGTVRFAGAVPAAKAINADADPYCQKAPIADESIVVSAGKLRDVVVRVTGGPLPPVPAVATKPPEVVIDQRACRYEPHVVAVQADADLVIRNGDGTFHNVHGTAGGRLLWNKPAPPGSPELRLYASADPVITEIACDVHPWMRAYAVTVGHPYVAVTGADGAFELPELPPGTYTVEAWHPVLGTRTAKVTVRAHGTPATTFTFKAK